MAEAKKLFMNAKFRILRLEPNGEYAMLTKVLLSALCVGGFTLVVDGKSISFDWDAHCCTEVSFGTFEYESGYGWLFNDHTLADYYDEELAELGLARNDLTAKFLASATTISEFFVSFDDGVEDDGSIGSIEGNAPNDAPYKVELISVTFSDNTEPDTYYEISPAVLDAYNKGILPGKEAS